MLSAPQELMLGVGKLMTVMTILMTSLMSRMMGKVSSFNFCSIFAPLECSRRGLLASTAAGFASSCRRAALQTRMASRV